MDDVKYVAPKGEGEEKEGGGANASAPFLLST